MYHANWSKHFSANRREPKIPILKLNFLVWSFSWISNSKQKMIETVRMGERKENVTTYKQESIWKWKKGSERVKSRGVQKTDKSKKPLQTNRTDAKISVRFWFGSVWFWFYYIKNRKFWFGFRWQILIHQTNRTESKYIK